MWSFINEAYFWTGFFGVVGSLGSLFIKDLLASKTQKNIERLRIHEKESLDAHKKLYSFIVYAENLMFPLDDTRQAFTAVMKKYATEVKQNKLYFTHEIREILDNFELQNAALGNSEIYPNVSFDDFTDKYLYKYFKSLFKIIEKKTDGILH
jgi:hypothetical protein